MMKEKCKKGVEIVVESVKLYYYYLCSLKCLNVPSLQLGIYFVFCVECLADYHVL